MNFNIDKIFEITCVCVLRCRDNELLNQARAEGREEGVELLLRRVEADFVTECLLPLSRGVQALLLAIRFNGQEAAMQAAAELEEAACSLFTRTDSYADKIVSARVLVLCYLFLNNFLATDGSEADVGNAVDHIHAMFEELCECPEVASAIHFELAKKTFSSLPGGRRSRQAALADLADLRQDVQTFTRYVLDVKDDKKETVFLHSIKPYQAVVHSRAINRALVYRQHLFTASADGTVKMFDCVTMSEKGLLVGHKKDVLSMAASDGRLFTGSRDKTIRIWDLLTLKESKICFRKHQNAVTGRLCS